jgi:phospholipid transport system substrate-binding protein
MRSPVLSLLPNARIAIAILAVLSPTTTAPAAGAPESKKGTNPPKSESSTPREGAAGDPKTTSSPMAVLKKSDGALKKLFSRRPPSWSPEADSKRDEMRKIVAGFLDFEELARRSLARHWDGLSAKQRSEFVATLRDLIERSYIKQVHGSPNYDLVFEKETIDGNEADVTAALHAMARGKKVDVSMEYKLLAKDGRWLVYDVITDEQSMLENYRAEFGKIINKESFDALLKRMKKKLEEKE